MSVIKIRFNTDKLRGAGDVFPWRVLIGDVERLALDVVVLVPSRTSEDVLPTGITKWHISCEGAATWSEEGVCTITRS